MYTYNYNPNFESIKLRNKSPIKDYKSPTQLNTLLFEKLEEYTEQKSTTTSYVLPTMFLDSSFQTYSVKVFNLPIDVAKKDLEVLFFKWSNINYQSLFYILDKEKGKFKGFVFVTFQSKEDATEFVKNVHGKVLENLIVAAQVVKR